MKTLIKKRRNPQSAAAEYAMMSKVKAAVSYRHFHTGKS